MDKAKKAVEDLCGLKEKLMCSFKEELNKGIQNVSAAEAGQVTDMIKDLAEAEEKCWKACYYKQIVEAMHEEKEMRKKMPMDQRMGYDNWRYSSGRFAPTGRGHYDPAGYTPMEDGQIPSYADGMHMEPWMDRNMMGYSDGRGGSGDGRSSGGNQNRSSSSDGRYGYTPSMRGMRYENYTKARRGYESGDPKAKEHMDTATREYVVDAAESIREMWKDADPNLRKEIKNRLTALAGEMN